MPQAILLPIFKDRQFLSTHSPVFCLFVLVFEIGILYSFGCPGINSLCRAVWPQTHRDRTRQLIASTRTNSKGQGDSRSFRSTSILSSVFALLDSNRSCLAPSSSSESVLSSLSVLPELQNNTAIFKLFNQRPAMSKKTLKGHLQCENTLYFS